MFADLIDQQRPKLPLGLLSSDEPTTPSHLGLDPPLLSLDLALSLPEGCLSSLFLLPRLVGGSIFRRGGRICFCVREGGRGAGKTTKLGEEEFFAEGGRANGVVARVALKVALDLENAMSKRR